jgi:hypothetical protein
MCAVKEDDAEDTTKQESFASFLLQRFQLATPERPKVTEVAEVTADRLPRE